jgi:hypothetical protein
MHTYSNVLVNIHHMFELRTSLCFAKLCVCLGLMCELMCGLPQNLTIDSSNAKYVRRCDHMSRLCVRKVAEQHHVRLLTCRRTVPSRCAVQVTSCGCGSRLETILHRGGTMSRLSWRARASMPTEHLPPLPTQCSMRCTYVHSHWFLRSCLCHASCPWRHNRTHTTQNTYTHAYTCNALR